MENKDYITITHGMSGYFAILMRWVTEHGGFYDIWDTGVGRYPSLEEACVEGRTWAKEEGLRFEEPFKFKVSEHRR